MKRRISPVLVFAIALVALAASVIYVQAARDSRALSPNRLRSTSTESLNPGAETPSVDAVASGLARTQASGRVGDAQANDVKSVSQSIAETASGDPATRAAAILALASAPKSAALPVLKNVLENGEPTVDRPLALRSLRDLALHQGDEDGAIRSAVREAIYHGDDEAVAQSAQGALEIIEESELK